MIIFMIFIFNVIEILNKILVGIVLFYLIIAIIIRQNKLTPKGELEKEKMGKLKLFLEKETDFKDKSEAERELWGRYSAFAVAFGLNKDMQEEIQKKIIKNKQQGEKL